MAQRSESRVKFTYALPSKQAIMKFSSYWQRTSFGIGFILAEAKGVEKKDKRILQFAAFQILVSLCPNSSL